VTKVRIVMVSPPWLSPRPLRSDAAWRGHGGWRWRIFETRYGGCNMLVMLWWASARDLFASWPDLTHVL